MTGATPRAHERRALTHDLVSIIETAQKAAAVKMSLEQIFTLVHDIVDRYHQSLLKAAVYPSPEVQCACSSGVVLHLKLALKAIHERDSETKKRSRSHLAGHHPDSARRREDGKIRERSAIAAVRSLIGAHEYACERAALYRRRGRPTEDAALVTVATELVEVWEQATGERLSISRNRPCRNGKLVTRGAPSAVFFAAMREGRERVIDLREPVSLAGSQSGEDRFEELAGIGED
jgi:hypothetical protein